MKKRIKKYALGTGTQGTGIPSPYESFADYNKMLAQTESDALNSKGVAIASMVGGILQQGLGMLGSAYTGGALGTKTPGTGTTAGQAVSSEIPTELNLTVPSVIDLGNKYMKALGDSGIEEDPGQEVEVEGGEAYETPQGQSGTFEGPSHEEGGIDGQVGEDIPQGTKIYSDRLKREGKTMAERKEAREAKQKSLMNLMEKNPNKAMKNTVMRKMKSLQQEDMADLQHQEMVQSLATATRAFQFAYGTGYRGVQKYADGTGPTGIGYAKGFDQSMFQPYIDEYMRMNPGAAFNLSSFHDWLGVGKKTSGYGKLLGPSSYALAQKKVLPPDLTGLGTGTPGGLTFEEQVKMNKAITEDTTTDTYMPIDPELLKGTPTKPEKGKLLDLANTYLPKVGDVVGLIGNYMAGQAGLKNAAEQRSRDITHTNLYDRVGEDAMKSFDAAELGLLGTEAQALLEAKTQARTGKMAARAGARGINTSRAMDLAYDIAEGKSANQIMLDTAKQQQELLGKKAQTQFQADVYKAKGEYEAQLANEAAQDAYYTAMGLGYKDQASSIQQTGKDLNQMAMNPIYMELLNNMGTYAGMTPGGKLVAKKTKVG
jgi:hypothetical protein